MFPSDEVRKKVLYHVGVWLMVMISVAFFFGDPGNMLHELFLEDGLKLLAVLVVGVVINSGVEVAISNKKSE